MGEIPSEVSHISRSDVKQMRRLIADFDPIRFLRRRGVPPPIETSVEGETRIVDVLSRRSVSYVRLIDPNPIGPNNVYLYEQITLGSTLFGAANAVTYHQGSLEVEDTGFLGDPVLRLSRTGNIPQDVLALRSRLEDLREGITLRKEVEGEPVVQFRRIKGVLEQLKAERGSKRGITLFKLKKNK